MKRLLVIFLLMSSLASASDFNVTWIPVKEDIVNKEYIITIQNLDTDMRTVDVESFFEDTNFDTSKIQDVEFYEQTVKPVTKEIKHYKTIQVSETISHIDNKTGMLINTTKIVNKRVLDYVEKKTINEKVLNKQKTQVLKNDKKMKEVSHGKITLPSVKTKGKISNVGTKTFVLRFKTPPTGSYGKVGLKINGKEYHPYWNSTWSNRKKITLTGTSSGSQTDYQILLNVSYEPEMNSDFSDLRFCNDTDQLSAWLESKVNESYALIWVKFPHTPANGETEDYWMYYGNSGASAYWNDNATFELFDNFSGSNVDANKWSVSGAGSYEITDSLLKITNTASTYKCIESIDIFDMTDKCIRYRDRVDVGAFSGSYDRTGIRCVGGNSDFWCIWELKHDDNVYIQIGGSSQTTGNNPRPDNSFCVLNMYPESGNTRFWRDDGFDITSTLSDDPPTSINIYWYGYKSNSDLDWILVRKYTSPEPTYAFGDTGYYVDSIYFNSSNPYYNLIDYKGDIALNHTYLSADDLDWTAQAVDDDTGLIVTSMGSSEIDFTTYKGILDWLQLVNLDNSKIYTLQNSSGDLEKHQASGNAVNFTTDLSPDDYQIEITAIPTPSPTITPTGVQPANYSGTKLSDANIKSFYYPFMYILFIVIIIGGFVHVFGN